MTDGIASGVKNDFSFPSASIVRFQYPARGQRGAVDLIWYEGGLRPPTPPELEEDHKEFPAEAMMFVGDKGKILSGFRVENPRLIPERRMSGYPPRPRRRALPANPDNCRRACASGRQPARAARNRPAVSCMPAEFRRR